MENAEGDDAESGSSVIFNVLPPRAPMTPSDNLWLTEPQHHAWRAYLLASRSLEIRLDHELQSVGMSLGDYEVLSMLSEAEGATMRMSALADVILQSRSRVTHTANRLERLSWVSRSGAPDDRRGVLISLTPTGAQIVDKASRLHVRGVREHFFDQIAQADLPIVAKSLDQVRRHFTGNDCECC